MKGLNHLKRLGHLVCGPTGRLSLGRVGFWLTYLLSVYFWLARPADYPERLWDTLASFLAYNLGGKLVNRKG
ncbi:MAG: hypothetical protein LBP55_08465 [Candidatus Adiutrix sp.]|jgi:hypothetical protein|nr:hypothetical protein [Candidatus Adiutrix sp.]